MAFKKIIIKKPEPKPIKDPNQVDLEDSIKEVKKRPKNIGRLVPLDELIAKTNALPPVTSSDLRPDIVKWDGAPGGDYKDLSLRGWVWALRPFDPFGYNKFVFMMASIQNPNASHTRRVYMLNEDLSPKEKKGLPIIEELYRDEFAERICPVYGKIGLQ